LGSIALNTHEFSCKGPLRPVRSQTPAPQLRAALASGAQLVSTDYPFPDDRFGTGYVAAVPGEGVARCDPVSASRRCARAEDRIARG
jgi:hypothetical protein